MAFMTTIIYGLFALYAALGADGEVLADPPSTNPAPTQGIEEVFHDRVQLSNGFWGPRQKTHVEVTIPHAIDRLEADGHVTNFDVAAGVSAEPLRGHHAFDSDLHKALEGGLISLKHFGDPALRARVDDIIGRILAAQEDDGFLIAYAIMQNRDQRWENLRLDHQLYNSGHFFEMAVEHHRLTGADTALAAARRFADHIDGIFGPGKRYDVGGHAEVELALVRLYRATGERRYLDLARFFLDERGHAHGTERKPFDAATVSDKIPSFDELPPAERNRAQRRARNSIRNGRMQDHKPLVQQQEAVGHAVRAGYLYSAMADIARFMDAPAYELAVEGLWRDVVSRKMYITGGLGTHQYHDEGFGDPYLLPNRTYCESCASIANVLWQHRMNLLKADAKYADVMELALYNSGISGIAVSGNAFFYQNPLESRGSNRQRWIGLSCCPTNLARFIPQVGGFAYAKGNGRLYVNLYLAGTASIALADGNNVTVVQQTDYPWDERVRMTVNPAQPQEFTVCLRIPGWSQGRPVPSDLYRFADTDVPAVTLKVNGQGVDAYPHEDGYVHLTRSWKAGDVLELNLPMPVQRVYAHENVEANRGKVALMRGPVVYCLEAADHPDVNLMRVALPRTAALAAAHRPQLLGGVTIICGMGVAEAGQAVSLTAIPYYAWCNRETGPMTVWVDDQGVLRPNQ